MHDVFIRRCLELAERGRGVVGNGAMVGAVLVRGHSIIAEGWHEAFGKPHAERMLLETLRRPVDKDDTLYVNLEPCCHHGKTPPCVDIVLSSGVRRVAFGMLDPDLRVTGKGIEALRRAGIEVIGPVLPECCERFNRGFISARTAGRPWLTLKRAITRDGSFSASTRAPLKITTHEQDIWSHTLLRSKHDAILVGVGTIIADNPLLNTRFAQSIPQTQGLNDYQMKKFSPTRIILDPHLRIPADAKVVSGGDRARTIIVTGVGERTRKADAASILEKRGVRILEIALSDGGSVDWTALWQALLMLEDGAGGITSILVEGGMETWRRFQASEYIDEEITLAGQD